MRKEKTLAILIYDCSKNKVTISKDKSKA